MQWTGSSSVSCPGIFCTDFDMWFRGPATAPLSPQEAAEGPTNIFQVYDKQLALKIFCCLLCRGMISPTVIFQLFCHHASS